MTNALPLLVDPVQRTSPAFTLAPQNDRSERDTHGWVWQVNRAKRVDWLTARQTRVTVTSVLSGYGHKTSPILASSGAVVVVFALAD